MSVWVHAFNDACFDAVFGWLLIWGNSLITQCTQKDFGYI